MEHDVEIEVFRADTRASRGITAEHIAEVAAFDCDAHPIPNVLGHPAGDKPAHGQVKKFRAEGSTLFATVPATAVKIWEGIKKGEILNRSMAFFDPSHEANPTPGKWAPRHLGWLGASAPGIPGMTPLSQVAKGLAFSADGETVDVLGPPADAVVYAPPATTVFTVHDDPKEPTPMERTPEQIAADEQRAREFTAREDAIAAREEAAAKRIRSQFEASNSAAIDGLVREGKILPAEVADLKTAFNALDPEAEELTFGAGDKAVTSTAASRILTFMASALSKRVPLGERDSPAGEPGEREFASPAEFRAAAHAMAKDEGITFEAATEKLAG